MRLRTPLVSVGVVAVLLLAACGGDDTTTKSASSSGEKGPQTLPVDVDADTAGTSLAFTSYFPDQLTAHPGDTVEFTSHFSGEPHTVTFGTLVDTGLAKADPNAESEPPELAKVPLLLPEGPGDANQSAGQPCYLATGEPSLTDACTKDQQKQPDFDGTQTYYNSGFLADGESFKVVLSDTIKPGTYNYFCTLHRAGMSGKITVVDKSATAQGADEVKAAGEAALSAAQTKMKATVEGIKAGVLPPFVPKATAGGVIAGGGSQDVPGAVPVIFGPDTVDVKVGQSVTWTIVGPHTITFGATEALRTDIVRAPDGAVHLNEEAFKPVGGAGQPQGPPPSAPPDPKAPPTPINGGSYNGTGLHNSGLVLAFPPNLFTYSVKFTKAGSFTYACMVHPDMKGTVNVT